MLRKIGPLVALSAVLLAPRMVQAQNKPFKVGQKFPSVTLKTIDGKTISPATLKKKPFWMTFFAAG